MREGDGYGLIRVRVKESKNESAMTKIYRSKCRIAKFAIYREKSQNFHIIPQNFNYRDRSRISFLMMKFLEVFRLFRVPPLLK